MVDRPQILKRVWMKFVHRPSMASAGSRNAAIWSACMRLSVPGLPRERKRTIQKGRKMYRGRVSHASEALTASRAASWGERHRGASSHADVPARVAMIQKVARVSVNRLASKKSCPRLRLWAMASRLANHGLPLIRQPMNNISKVIKTPRPIWVRKTAWSSPVKARKSGYPGVRVPSYWRQPFRMLPANLR